jgi:hypothetical protein
MRNTVIREGLFTLLAAVLLFGGLWATVTTHNTAYLGLMAAGGVVAVVRGVQSTRDWRNRHGAAR